MSVGDGFSPAPVISVKATSDSDIICKSTWVHPQGSRTQEAVGLINVLSHPSWFWQVHYTCFIKFKGR
ncbi:hypothetical protein PO909_001431 [Leuciscus waleckii]